MADAPLRCLGLGPLPLLPHPSPPSSSAPPPSPHLCLVSHLASRTTCTTFALRSYPVRTDDAPSLPAPPHALSCCARRAAAAPLEGDAGAGRGARVSGDDGVSLIDALRATSAAPFFLDPVSLLKNLHTGDISRAAGGGATEEEHSARLVLLDGGILCNNPSDVAVHEARRMFGHAAPIALLSIGANSMTCRAVVQSNVHCAQLTITLSITGTGGPIPCESPPPPAGFLSSAVPSWVWPLVAAAGDVVRATSLYL